MRYLQLLVLFFARLAGVAALAFGLALPAVASDWVKADYVEGRLVAATQGTGDSAELLAAIDLKLDPKWKTYWRAPGDAGLPPETDWTGSDNVAAASLLYPAPVRFQLFGLQTFGYADRVVFPVRVKLERPGEAANLKLKLNLLVCSDVCVPQVLDLSHAVPAGKAVPSDVAHDIQRAMSAVPSDAHATGISVKNAQATYRDGISGLSVEIDARQRLDDLDIIPVVTPFAAFSAPKLELRDDRKRATAFFALSQPLPAGESLDGRKVDVTVTSGAIASESTMTVTPGEQSPASASFAWVAILATAILGGLILNLMPCVLPVLSVKMLSVLEAQKQSSSDVRAKFLMTSVGIIASLLALAATLVVVKSLGHAAGWGVQFQQPWFIAAMAVIVILFACNLWGFFEFALPSSLSSWAGNVGAGDSSYVGHFLTGVFVTILATPCSAPFVGTAVGFALASGTLMTFLIFAGLGVGLALPYIAVATYPSMVRILPRPGPWMVKLKVVLGFALLATAIWLVGVLAGQAGLTAALLTALCLAAIVVVLAPRVPVVGHLSRTSSAAIAIFLAGLAVAVPTVLQHTAVRTVDGDRGPVAWTTFDNKELRSLIAQGKTIFVDVTADWCITCKANKRLVVYQSPVADRLNDGVIAMQADWTSPDPAITDFLARYGRYGIPMNVVFGPGSPQGIVLPELLTADRVIEALRQASQQTKS